MFKKHKIILLPSIGFGKIAKDSTDDSNKLHHRYDETVCNHEDFEHYHLYIISDEELEINDWVLETKTNNVYKAGIIIKNSSFCKKIIASTNEELKLFSIPSDFIEKYCELSGFDKVLVEYEQDWYVNGLYTEPNGFKVKITENNTISVKMAKTNWNERELINLIFKFKDIIAHKLEMNADTGVFHISEMKKFLEDNLK